ncbi:MAG TPA: PEGA domain-containing protein [Kofleriaceae bacterium]|nr:PEGA domain-containing protein [Kofleriaceae bacterium]
MRLALICAFLCSSFAVASAQGEIEMEEDTSMKKPDPPPDAPPADAPPADTPPADQPIVKDPKVAKKWLQAGDLLMKNGDKLAKQNKLDEAKVQYTNAVTAYQKAMEASDDVAAVPLNWQLANAEDKAGDTPSALKHMKLVVDAQGMKPDLVKKAQAKLDEMSMKVGVLTLTVAPDGTQISINGKQVGEAPMTEPLVLMPGAITVSFSAVGYQPKDVEFKIEAGSESERKIALEAVPIVTKPVDNDIGPEPEPDKPKQKNPMIPVYIGAGATGALLLTATITGIIAVGDHATYVDPKASNSERADAQSGGRTMAHITDICLVGMIGAAAFTSYWYLYKVRPQQQAMAERQAARRRPASNPSKVGVVPWVEPQAGGLVAVGSF